jgi:hypothetical protein
MHLHFYQMNAESTGNCTRGIPALRAGSQRVRKEDERVPHMLPHATGASRLVVSQAGYHNFHKKDIRVSHVLPHAMGASSLPHRLVFSDPFQGQQLPACSSSPHHRLVPSDPFQGQQLPACVRVTTAENSGVSARVLRTYRLPTG